MEHPLNDSEYANVGETMKIHVSVMKLVTWHAGASVIVSSAEQTARHGHTATVECAVYATPPPFHISWRRHQHHIDYQLLNRFKTIFHLQRHSGVTRVAVTRPAATECVTPIYFLPKTDDFFCSSLW